MEKELTLESFLTRIESRRFSILKLFEQEHKNSLSVEKISLKLGLSERTIKRTIIDIQSDIETFGFKDNISLNLYIGNNSKLYCSLHYQLTFSMHYMLREYLKNSIFFLIIKDLFFDSSFSIKKAIDKYFVTNSTLRRYLKKIDKELHPFNLKLSIKKELTITGDEATIRLFYTSLFFEVYEGEQWPFSFISQKEVNDLLDHFPQDIYSPVKYAKRTYFQLFLAISILRIRKKEKIENRMLFFTYQNETEHQHFLKEVEFIKLLCPMIPVTQLQIELAFMHSLVLSYGPYSNSKSISHFFIKNPELAKSNFFANVLLWVNEIEKYLYVPLSLEEENDLIYATCILYYRLKLFKQFNLSADKNWIEESTLDNTFKFQIDLLRGILSDITKTTILLKINEHHLKFHYIETLFSCVDVTKFMPPIHLVLFSRLGQTMKRYILNYGDLFNNFNLSLIEGEKETVDVVISDRPISKKNFSYSVTEQTKYVLWQEFPTKKNYEDLKKLLILICKDKLPFDV
ncbi:helix-turn-helix domain-containing protein [Enterococcus ureasiticus]|uniref:Mga helix-turn-helix domain-containing protein n=1 Tax=Enterococcus ureasiticus TaxID=903984 RepID=A0A1E5G9Y3_9ENTE|nr:helix-turn-helix domain-containing protein [Enterococcus ureasiticus]OEG09512.1 hypothetical protein BCR21_14265 [Enterococcus ureasiticus]